MLTPEQHRHLKELMVVSDALMIEKYVLGANKHGGNLKDLSILELNNEALQENTDQRFYLLEQRSKIIEFKEKYDGSGMERNSEELSETALRPLPNFPAEEIFS